MPWSEEKKGLRKRRYLLIVYNFGDDILRGEIPSPIALPPGCNFHPRCPIGVEICQKEIPSLREIEEGHWVACHLA